MGNSSALKRARYNLPPPAITRNRRQWLIWLTVFCLASSIFGGSEYNTLAAEAGNLDPVSSPIVIRYERYELVLAAAWSADGRMLAVSAGESIYLYEAPPPEGEQITEIGRLDAHVWSPAIAFSPDGMWLAAGGKDGFVRIWEVAELLQGEAAPAIPTREFQAHRKGTNDVEFGPGGFRLASAGNDGMARLWNLEGLVAGGEGEPEPEVEMIGGSFAVPSIGFTPNGSSLAISNQNVIRLRDTGSSRFVQTLQRESPTNQEISFYSLSVSRDGRRLAAGDTENGVVVWDLETGAQFPAPEGHSGRPERFTALVWGVAFSPDGEILASAGGDTTLRLWEVASGKTISILRGHTLGATCLVFSPDGKWLLSGSLDATARLWQVGG